MEPRRERGRWDSERLASLPRRLKRWKRELGDEGRTLPLGLLGREDVGCGRAVSLSKGRDLPWVIWGVETFETKLRTLLGESVLSLETGFLASGLGDGKGEYVVCGSCVRR